MANEYKIQIVHLAGSIFIELYDIDTEEDARKEAEAQYKDNKQYDMTVLWVALWRGNDILDTFAGDGFDGHNSKWGSDVLSEMRSK